MEEFKPIRDSAVGLYTCGPTVYNYAHIGNLEAYLFWDLLKRALRHDGYTVRHVMNVTDVGHLIGDMDYGEDKVKSAALKEHKSVKEVVDFYTKQFMEDAERLNIIMPEVVRNASDEIVGILALIDTLDRKGYLYRLADGMYFDTSRFKDYGALAGMDFETLKESIKAGARVGRPEGMRNPTDFAVWRLSKPGETEMVWDSKYGRGFPGWHIECSEISMKYLGSHFDIHCGGADHIQVHHPNEIAQSEAATGEKFVNYWLHNRFMKVDGRKMSKSLGNVYTVQDLIAKGYSPLAFRYLVLSSHYRSELNFTFEALDNAEETLKRVYTLLESLSDVDRNGPTDKGFEKAVRSAGARFYEELNDDLGMPEALSAFHKLVSLANQRIAEGSMTKSEADLVTNALLEIDRSILALDLDKRSSKVKLPLEVERMLQEREQLRAKKDFAAADEIRKRLKEDYGIELVDTKDGVRVRKTG